jgi:ligand-binding sensor domain-containing protein
MIRQLFNWTIILALTLWGTSCNGQTKNDLPRETVSVSKLMSVGKPKLLITQGPKEGGNVHCSLQDRTGNLWFGTTGEGVYRYDGNSFSQFTTANGLNGNMIHCILEDRDGRIWIGTDTGICLYNGKTFTDIQIPSPFQVGLPSKPIPKKNHVFSIMQDQSGKLWFATIKGVYFYDGKSFTPFVINEGARGYMSKTNNVEHILEDQAGNIWFGGRVNEGVFRYDGETLTNYKLEKLNGHDWAWPVLQDKNGIIWFSNWGGTYRYDGKSFTSFTKRDGLCIDVVARIIEDKSGNLWFGGGGEEGGLCRYDGETFTHFSTKDGLPHNGVWTILEDNTGNIWVGTRTYGVCRYDGRTCTRFSE